MDPPLLEDLDVQADGGDGLDGVAVRQCVQEGRFARVLETNDDHVELLREEDVEQLAEHVSHGESSLWNAAGDAPPFRAQGHRPELPRVLRT